MEKKLTAQGPKNRKSFTVTLPKDWVNEQGLSKKRLVDLEIVGNKIIIHPMVTEENKVVLDGKLYYNSLIKVLPTLYKAGVKEIKITNIDTLVISKVNTIIDGFLIGYELIEQKKDYLVIKEITKESTESFENLLRRVFLLLMELSEIKDEELAEQLDKNIDKMTNYCLKILIQRGYSKYKKTMFYYHLIDDLEKIGDEYRWMFKWKLMNKQSNMLKEINLGLRNLYELFYKFDEKKYNQETYKMYKLKNQIKISKNMNVVDMHLHNIARRLMTMYGDVFAIRFPQKD